jgi:hypothetical protein
LHKTITHHVWSGWLQHWQKRISVQPK